MYAIGADVMLTANLWTETGLPVVNGACGKIDSESLSNLRMIARHSL